MRLLSVDSFRELYFFPGEAPDKRSVRAWIDDGELPGRRIGKKYYVDADAWERSTGNALADRIMGVGQ